MKIDEELIEATTEVKAISRKLKKLEKEYGKESLDRGINYYKIYRDFDVTDFKKELDELKNMRGE